MGPLGYYGMHLFICFDALCPAWRIRAMKFANVAYFRFAASLGMTSLEDRINDRSNVGLFGTRLSGDEIKAVVWVAGITRPSVEFCSSFS